LLIFSTGGKKVKKTKEFKFNTLLYINID
jgi:hypothetical protein